MIMISIEVKDLVGNELIFEVSSHSGIETDWLELDGDTLQWVSSVLSERPFKPKPNEVYSWFVIETEESSSSPEKKLTIEVQRGKSRVKRKSVVPKAVFLKFWNFLHHQKLPSELGSSKRAH